MIGGKGEVIEYAIVMREFPQSALFDAALARGEIDLATLEALAHKIAAFHASARDPSRKHAHDPAAMALMPAMDNFNQMLSLLKTAEDIQMLGALREWTSREYQRTSRLIGERIGSDRIRECHGDLHLGNIALIDGVPTPFDCLEFAPGLRWIDVMSEVAFPMMDLESHSRRDLAYGFLNAYLETSGDYDGVPVLPFYLVYRAIVRAKISLIRAAQAPSATEQGDSALAGYQRYLALATRYTEARRGAIIITHGLSGSGKSTLAQRLLSTLGALRVRSDLERNRLHGISAFGRTGAAPGAGIYSVDTTKRTYERLAQHARSIAGAGFPALVDATVLQRDERTAFRMVAEALEVPFAIVSVAAPHEILRERVLARAACGRDASEATVTVLDAQIGSCEPLTAEELRYSVLVDANRDTATNVRDVCNALAYVLHEPEAVTSQ